MKRNYISPKINVILLEALCDGGNGGIVTASVHRESTKGECISKFDVVNEKTTKKNNEYKGLWGESNSDKWGDD